uniref:Si:ch211-286b5.2 n=1 Tax=Sinocyclocheilus anshuiensis TaxID=1608454 RepID=A0A671KEJ1_9TELE
ADAGKCLLAEFKPPKRAKRQKSTEATNQSEDENQTLTPESENNNSHNALCSDKLDEHQPGQSTLQDTQTTEFPVDPCCSLEEKTSHYDNNEFGNGTNPLSHEIEQTAAVPLQTPELDKSDKHTLSRPLNTEAINVDQPNRELDDEEREITRNSNHQSQKVPDDCDSELPSDEHQTERESSHEGNTATEPKMDEQLGSSDIVAETSYDQIQMPEDAGSADPLVKRNIRKRMGMCRLGERKKMLKGQLTRGNVFEGSQENEAGEITNEGPVMTSDGLKKDISISVEEEGVTESEVSVPSFSTSCPMEDTPVQEQQEQPGNEVQILVKCMSREPVTHETDNAIPSHADADDLNPLEQNETECTEQNATESNIREDSNEVTTEIGTEVPVDFAEVCKDSTDISAQEEVVIAGSLEVPKEANEGSASASEVANQFGEELVAGGDKTEQCSPCECDMNASTSDHTSEQCVELMDVAADETIRAPPVIHETEDKCESSDFSQVAATVTAENKADNRVSSLSIPAAPPGGDNEDVQPLRSPAAEPDPSSPLSMHSVTDSQLNNIPLSLEDLPISEASCDLEDATELVCGLIRDIHLNTILIFNRSSKFQS